MYFTWISVKVHDDNLCLALYIHASFDNLEQISVWKLCLKAGTETNVFLLSSVQLSLNVVWLLEMIMKIML